MKIKASDMNWVGMPPVTRITDRLYLGCFRDGTDARVEAVCNCTDEDYSCPAPWYLRLDQEDGEHVAKDTIDSFIDWMVIQQHRGRRVLVHCHAGISRSASFVILWMMFCDGVKRDADLKSAWSERQDLVGQLRPIIYPHYKIKQSLLQWYEQYGPR